MNKLRGGALLISGALAFWGCGDDSGSQPTETTLTAGQQQRLDGFERLDDVIDEPDFQELYELSDEDLGRTKGVLAAVLNGFDPSVAIPMMSAYARGGGSDDKPMPLFSILWEDLSEPDFDIMNPE